MNKEDIKVKPFWVRCMCLHKFTGGMKVVYTPFTKQKKYAHICTKCGQRRYVN